MIKDVLSEAIVSPIVRLFFSALWGGLAFNLSAADECKIGKIGLFSVKFRAGSHQSFGEISQTMRPPAGKQHGVSQQLSKCVGAI